MKMNIICGMNYSNYLLLPEKNKKEVNAVSRLVRQERMEVPEPEPEALLGNPWRKLERDPWTQEVEGKTDIEKN